MGRKSASSSPETKPWTVLVYLAGDNNLSPDMVWSLQEMKKAARDPRTCDALHLSTLFDAPGSNPRRYDVVAPGAYATTRSEDGDLDELPHVLYPEEAAARKLLGRFLGERLEALPRSRHRLVVLSGHGSGAVGAFLTDEESKSALTIPALAKILARAKAASGGPTDVLGLDSCGMSGIEVGYEVRSAVRYLVASEGLVLDTGWPYHRVVESVASRAGGSPLDVARQIALRYLAFYQDYDVAGLSTDVSVTDLDILGPVADSVGALAKAMAAPLGRLADDGLEEAIELGRLERSRPEGSAERARAVRNAILLAHWSAQSYRCDRYADLYDFVEQLLRFSMGGAGEEFDSIRAAGADALKAIGAAVVFSGSTGAEFQHSHGLSIYFPWSSADYAHEYRRLAFSKASGWGEFLEVYLSSTRRMRRDQAGRVERVKRGRGLALDSEGNEIVPREPLLRPALALSTRDVSSGTHKDVDSGTHKGQTCRSTMKNPPDGHYQRTFGDDVK